MRSVVLDAETTIRNSGPSAIGSLLASPFLAENKIVALGEQWSKGGERVTNMQYGDIPVCHALEFAANGFDTLLIGHNVSFDLLFLLKEFPEKFDDALPHLFIWDTAEVEYLLSGQRHMYPSLDECCIARGLPVKDDKIKEYWNQGIDTPHIPKDELLTYLQGDLDNTYAVFLDQWETLRSNPNLYLLVKEKMDDILMTTLMTWNGMKFDLVTAQAHLKELDATIHAMLLEIVAEAKPHFIEGFDFNAESPSHISLLLFGGEYKVIEDCPVLGEDGEPTRYKGGQRKGEIKTRKEAITYSTKGLGLPTKGIPPSRGLYSTADEYLAKLKHPVVQKIQKLREASKDAETYYRGYAALVWPDGLIHPNRNHTSTVTGRLSCSQPNLENVSKDDD